ncbi:hypothetical protein [Streptomyces sp. NPDC050485]|uniref:hypothetical protein n=1 Tax=Streptomyces sp. NPDC050485 TaxID=3365617 RepID=UPI00378A8A60
MEQRSEHQYMPLGGAATDPAYVPGLVPARAASPGQEHPPGEALEDDVVAEADEGGGPQAAAGEEAAAGGVDRADGDAEDSEGESEAEGGGPVFEVSDRQGSIVADRRGVRLRLANEEADFRWDELSAVEHRTPRWSRRFEIVVYTPAYRRFSHDVEASDRAGLKEWTEQLEAVLDAYFEE